MSTFENFFANQEQIARSLLSLFLSFYLFFWLMPRSSNLLISNAPHNSTAFVLTECSLPILLQLRGELPLTSSFFGFLYDSCLLFHLISSYPSFPSCLTSFHSYSIYFRSLPKRWLIIKSELFLEFWIFFVSEFWRQSAKIWIIRKIVFSSIFCVFKNSPSDVDLCQLFFIFQNQLKLQLFFSNENYFATDGEFIIRHQEMVCKYLLSLDITVRCVLNRCIRVIGLWIKHRRRSL